MRKTMTDIDSMVNRMRTELGSSRFDPVAKYAYLTGQRFGKLVIQYIQPAVNEEGKAIAHCLCDCGREKDLRVTHLTHGLVKSCSQCGYRERVVSERSSLDLVGKRFGELTAIRRSDRHNFSNVVWECECPKGHKVYIAATRLANGKVSHCSLCRRGEHYAENLIKKPPMYKRSARDRIALTRLNMLSRCNNPGDSNYKTYGGRGIKVCPEWSPKGNGLDNFYNWSLNHGWKPGLTIDRIDVNGDYCPENCRWVSMRVQNNNRSNNRRVTVLGQTKTVAEWARELEINPDRLYRFSDSKIATCVGTLLEAKRTIGDAYYELIKRRIF